MPIRNEANFIARSLGAILRQDYPHDHLEILIADGMSDDGTREAIQAIAAEHPQIRLEIVDNPGRIVPTGFNAALERSRGAIIVRVDGHTTIASDYVRQCVGALQTTGADNVGGRMAAVGETAFARAVALVTSSRFGVGNAQFHYLEREAWVDTVYMGAWPRRVFEKFGLFDEEQVRNQDDEFNYRLREQGGKVLLSPRIKSSYYNRSHPNSLWRQYFQYGYWKVRVMQKHPAQMRAHQFLPPLFVATIIVSAAIAPVGTIGRWILALAAGAYAAGNLSATALLAHKSAWPQAPNLALAFCLLHFGYGFGFLTGLVKFRNRWTDRGVRKFLAVAPKQERMSWLNPASEC
jgi:glycosyltransferase involved in cell wall biosynthesis